MKLTLLILFQCVSACLSYNRLSFDESCTKIGFNFTFDSTPGLCYYDGSIDWRTRWQDAWAECAALGSGPGLRALLLQPTTAQLQDDFLRPRATKHWRWSSIGLMARIDKKPCALYAADYFGIAPSWIEHADVKFAGMGEVGCELEHPAWATFSADDQRAVMWDTEAWKSFRYQDCPVQWPNSGERDAVSRLASHFCQMTSFAKAQGLLQRQKQRSEAELSKYRFRVLAASSLAQCTLACLRSGGCFGLGFGGGRCELFRIAPEEMGPAEGGWAATDDRLPLYAFDWPRRV